MIEIRIHGRGGQGAVVASKLLADAVFKEGKHVQVFPEFGVERRGAPVAAFARIDTQPINLRCKVYEPDCVVVLDPTLLASIDVTAGLKEGGLVLINSDKLPQDFNIDKKFTVETVDATSIAVKHHLGSRATPIVNTAIVGAFAKISGLVKIESVLEAVKEEVPVKPDENAAAASEAYDIAKAREKIAKGAKKEIAKTAKKKPAKGAKKRPAKAAKGIAKTAEKKSAKDARKKSAKKNAKSAKGIAKTAKKSTEGN